MLFLEFLQALIGGGGENQGLPPREGDVLPRGDIEVRLVSIGPRKIAVIKEARRFGGFGLKQAKDLVESAPTVLFRVATPAHADRAAAALRAAGADVALPGTPREASLREVHFVHIEQPKNKIAAIKALRGALNLGLLESKTQIDRAPCSLGPFGEEDALRVLMALTDTGVVAEIR